MPVESTHHALKEWAVAVAALREGAGIVTVRKGGIREEGREFRMEHRQFVFFPTFEHQKAEQLQPRFHADLAQVQAAAPAPGWVRLDTWARVTDVIEVTGEREVRALDDFYVFSGAYALERLQWRPRKPLHVLLLRVYRLSTPCELPVLDRYGGCKSWIELDAAIELDASNPALSDPAFSLARERALAALRGEAA
jgi:hypothetical protein